MLQEVTSCNIKLLIWYFKLLVLCPRGIRLCRYVSVSSTRLRVQLGLRSLKISTARNAFAIIRFWSTFYFSHTTSLYWRGGSRLVYEESTAAFSASEFGWQRQYSWRTVYTEWTAFVKIIHHFKLSALIAVCFKRQSIQYAISYESLY